MFNFMACCMREKLQRFVVIWFSKAARLNITHCSTEGVLVLAFASWRIGVIAAHKPPDHALLHLKSQQQLLLIADSQHGPGPHLTPVSQPGKAGCTQLVSECLEHLVVLFSLLHIPHYSHCHSDCLVWLQKKMSKWRQAKRVFFKARMRVSLQCHHTYFQP